MKTIHLEEVNDELREIGRRLLSESFADPLRGLIPVVRDGFAGNFSRATGQDGTGWPPRKSPGDGHPLLQETGALFGATQGGLGGVAVVEDRDLAVGVDASVYSGGIRGAKVHNFGFPDRNIPQREFIYASEDVLETIDTRIADAALTILLPSLRLKKGTKSGNRSQFVK